MVLSRTFAPCIAALAAMCFAGAAPAVALPGLTERIVSDPSNGIALFGFDPVAYFTEGRAVPGKREHEAEWGGAAWRFASAANQAAFLSAPEVYAPRFGGYDPAAVAKGVAAPGHPLLYAIRGDRLYLFRSPAERDGFGDPRPAERAWPRVEANLAR